MLRALGTHLRDQWMGALALFLVLGGGTAYAAGTIGSEDIIDHSIRSIDLRNDDVRSIDVRDDSLAAGGLGAADLAPGSVAVSELDPAAFAPFDIGQGAPGAPFEIVPDAITGSEVLDGSMTGADVAESTLAGLDGHDAYRDLCDTPSDNSFRECLTLTFALGRSMPVLVVYGGGGGHGSPQYAPRAYGECTLRLDGDNKRNPVNLVNDYSTPTGMASIVDVMTLSAGSHTVAIACRENTSDMHFEDLSIGVVELAAD